MLTRTKDAPVPEPGGNTLIEILGLDDHPRHHQHHADHRVGQSAARLRVVLRTNHRAATVRDAMSRISMRAAWRAADGSTDGVAVTHATAVHHSGGAAMEVQFIRLQPPTTRTVTEAGSRQCLPTRIWLDPTPPATWNPQAGRCTGSETWTATAPRCGRPVDRPGEERRKRQSRRSDERTSPATPPSSSTGTEPGRVTLFSGRTTTTTASPWRQSSRSGRGSSSTRRWAAAQLRRPFDHGAPAQREQEEGKAMHQHPTREAPHSSCSSASPRRSPCCRRRWSS